jgi:hypothetical protein
LPDESGAFRADVLFPESDHALVLAEFVLPWQFVRRCAGPDVRAESCGREPVAASYNFVVAVCLNAGRGDGPSCVVPE